MKTTKLIHFCLVLLLSFSIFASPFFLLAVSADANAGTVTKIGSTGYRDLWESYQERSFYAYGRFWVFYYNGTNGSHDHLVFTSSSNSITWRDSQLAVTEPIDASHSYSIWFDGEYVHVFASIDWGTVLMYKRGLPHTNGSISWGNEQTIIGSPYKFDLQNNYVYLHGCVDSNGYPWIAYEMFNSTSKAIYGSYAIKSSVKDGAWQTAAGFPYKLSSITPQAGFGQGIYPLTNGKVLAIYVSSGFAFARAWDGTKWLSEVQTTAKVDGDHYGYFTWNAVPQGDDVHMVYCSANLHNGAGYEKYTYASNSFGPESVVQEDVGALNWGYTETFLDLDPQTNTLYCFWINPTSNFGDRHYNDIVYKKCVNGNWDSSHTQLLNRTSNDILSPLSISVSNIYQGHVGVIFITGAQDDPPYDVNFLDVTIDSSTTNPSASEIPLDIETTPLWTPAYLAIIILFVLSVIAMFKKGIKRKDTPITNPNLTA